MLAILYALRKLAIDLLKSRSRLEAENLLLRHQLNVVFRIAAIPILTGLHHKYARISFSEGTTVARGSIQNDVTTAWRRQW